MKPRVRHKLISGLFNGFISNFFYMFNDNEFVAGQEFVSDFITNLTSRVYLPDNEIIMYGESFDELIMIQESVVSVSLRVDKFYKYKRFQQPEEWRPL